MYTYYYTFEYNIYIFKLPLELGSVVKVTKHLLLSFIYLFYPCFTYQDKVISMQALLNTHVCI